MAVAGTSRGGQNTGAIPKRSREIDTLSIYASDNEEEMPGHMMSEVVPSHTYQPMERQQPILESRRYNIERCMSNRPRHEQPQSRNTWKEGSHSNQQFDLRNQLTQRHNVGAQSFPRAQSFSSRIVTSQTLRQNMPGSQSIFAPIRVEPSQGRTYEYQPVSVRFNRTLVVDIMTKNGNYVWQCQQPIVSNHDQYKIVLPPVCLSAPINLSKKDDRIIGMAEMHMQSRNNSLKCPKCKDADHKLIHCNYFMRAGLLERWYIALTKGVCLNCLIRGHTSFTCMNQGCRRCQVRHNSKLCPRCPLE